MARPASLPYFLPPLAFFGAFAVLGVRDLTQRRHAILRNYPIAAHMRSSSRRSGPRCASTFSRPTRTACRSRATSGRSSISAPSGARQAAVRHAIRRLSTAATSGCITRWRRSRRPRSRSASSIGGADCGQPYSASVLNISAMSFGSLSANAIRALNKGAKLGGFAHDTGEGGFSPYHRENGGDIIWEIGSGYFGCRNSDGAFSPERFAETAAHRPDQDDRDQDQPGCQAGARRRAACRQGDARNRRASAASRWARLHLAGPATRRSQPDRD